MTWFEQLIVGVTLLVFISMIYIALMLDRRKDRARERILAQVKQMQRDREMQKRRRGG